jgi:hypothetical protein
MRSLIGWGCVLALVCIVGGLYVVNTSPGVENGSEVNSLAKLPDKVAALPQYSSLSQSPDITAITLSPPVQALAHEAEPDEPLDADDMSFVYDDSPQQNVGEVLDADDMSLVFDDSPQQNVGEALDADDMSFVYDDSPQQNVGEAIDADDMSFVLDDSPQQNVGAALDADAMAFFYDDSPQQDVGAALDADAQ